MAIRNVVGREFDGSTYNLTIGKTVIPFISFSYGDNVESEWIYESGTQIPSAQTEGQYKPADGKLKVRGVVYRGIIVPNMPRVGMANVRTVAVVNFVLPGVGTDSDALFDFRIMGPSGVSLEASAKANEVELTCKYRYVAWTSARKVWGNPNGAGYVGTFGL